MLPVRFNKKNRPGPDFPPMNPKGGKKKVKKRKK
jgi:hypothetical protein